MGVCQHPLATLPFPRPPAERILEPVEAIPGVPVQEFSSEDLLGPLNEVEKKKAPAKLYLAGDPDLVRGGARVSVVGSRQASSEGCRRAGILARNLVDHGITVVSGLAEGVDTIAHEAAIARHGRTVAVIGTGLDRCYPKKNKSLQERIAREHLLISQFPPGTPPRRGNFPMRNRTMALLTSATIIVEAGEGSGTLHQGWEALRLGRLLFLLASVAEDPDLSWPGEMIRYGAQVLSRQNLDDVAEELSEIRSGEAIAL